MLYEQFQRRKIEIKCLNSSNSHVRLKRAGMHENDRVWS